MSDPWSPDPEGDRRFLEAVERMDVMLMASDRKVIKPHGKRRGQLVPARSGKHVHARHAARRRRVVPMWALVLILGLQLAAVVAVLL